MFTHVIFSRVVSFDPFVAVHLCFNQTRLSSRFFAFLVSFSSFVRGGARERPEIEARGSSRESRSETPVCLASERARAPKPPTRDATTRPDRSRERVSRAFKFIIVFRVYSSKAVMIVASAGRPNTRNTASATDRQAGKKEKTAQDSARQGN